MLPDAAFLLSLAGLNASLAGLGGLLVGLRRGPSLQPLEMLRLRQVVEFAFANMVLAVAVQPCALVLGDTATAIRVASGVALAYVLSALLVLQRRVTRVGISWGRWWAASAVGLTILAAFIAAATIVVTAAGMYELLLVALLARPMAAFILVLGTMEEEAMPGHESPAQASAGR